MCSVLWSLLGLVYVRNAAQTYLDSTAGFALLYFNLVCLCCISNTPPHCFLWCVSYYISVLAGCLSLKHYFRVITPWSWPDCIDCTKWKLYSAALLQQLQWAGFCRLTANMLSDNTSFELINVLPVQQPMGSESAVTADTR